MSEIRKRVALALQDWHERHLSSKRLDFDAMADIVLEAIREPTEEMVEAGENAGCGVSDFRIAAELTWFAMHAAALAEKEAK